MAEESDLRLVGTRQVQRLKIAEVVESDGCATNRRVALTSWYALLESLERADPSMAFNVRQLRSLANAQDDDAFAPLHADDLNPAIPRRQLDYCRIVDDVVNTGAHDGWMSVQGLKATAQRDGYLRFFQFRTDDGDRMSKAIALYFSADRWVKSGTTPVWLRFWHPPEQHALARQTEIEYEKDPGGSGWVAVRLLTGVEYSDVFENVVAQVKRVRDIIIQALESGETS